jgi:hypothetical protein
MNIQADKEIDFIRAPSIRLGQVCGIVTILTLVELYNQCQVLFGPNWLVEWGKDTTRDNIVVAIRL